ncbi:hypothetical protein COU15_00035 [Candidatus Kaiserbacteria bacterium CG10_big_fil_rev_8_21_14_0_10_45_20]|uniref:Uncharacterized protein n=1 Tax=Candidatus Kaiserbacteria bacterium CG10_big_fil_rev_8_21_14_0_10_45_20 TaxID=1974607 RepID=A0A2H0UGG3_9BACT|nr:MAG: hypothetical protein COU15_00035 [Candidatus Kaiserbacteria bacterium CG10_big_fil_rev_8_21_14_0_10_45_20]
MEAYTNRQESFYKKGHAPESLFCNVELWPFMYHPESRHEHLSVEHIQSDTWSSPQIPLTNDRTVFRVKKYKPKKSKKGVLATYALLVSLALPMVPILLSAGMFILKRSSLLF